MKLSNILGEVVEHLESALNLMDKAIEEAEHLDSELVDKQESIDILEVNVISLLKDIEKLKKKNGK